MVPQGECPVYYSTGPHTDYTMATEHWFHIHTNWLYGYDFSSIGIQFFRNTATTQPGSVQYAIGGPCSSGWLYCRGSVTAICLLCPLFCTLVPLVNKGGRILITMSTPLTPHPTTSTACVLSKELISYAIGVEQNVREAGSLDTSSGYMRLHWSESQCDIIYNLVHASQLQVLEFFLYLIAFFVYSPPSLLFLPDILSLARSYSQKNIIRGRADFSEQ